MKIKTFPKSEIIENYINKETDIGKMLLFVSKQTFIDGIIDGNAPWDYAKEIELCMKKQGFLK